MQTFPEDEDGKIGEEFGGVDFRTEARNERLFNYMILLLIAVVVGAIGYQFVTYGPGSAYAERDRLARLAQREANQAADLRATEAGERREYYAALASADSLYRARAYDPAAFYYRRALRLFQDSLPVRVRLLETYAANCAAAERQCANADTLRARLLQRPDVIGDAALLERVR